MSFDLPFGPSHGDPSVHRDQHDALGLSLQFLSGGRGDALQPTTTTKKKRTTAPQLTTASQVATPRSGAPQPTSRDCSPQPAPKRGRTDHKTGAYVDSVSDSDVPMPTTSTHEIHVVESSEPDLDDADDVDPETTNDANRADPTTESLVAQMRAFWERHRPLTLTQVDRLRRILFAKVKIPVPQDVWIDGASEPGEQQHVNAVVSRNHVLRQLQRVMELRHEWLEQKGLPLTFQMRDGKERKEFIAYARGLYEQEEYQVQKQNEDWLKGGKARWKEGKGKRWTREKQRRCGTHQMWDIISFSGKLDAEFLEQGLSTQATASADASQLGDEDNVPKERTRLAHKAREDLRWAEHLARAKAEGRTRFTRQDQYFLAELANGNLLRKANDATRASGHGRLRKSDGTYEDIGGSTGGLTRTVLDNWKPPDLEDPLDLTEPTDQAEPPYQTDSEAEHDDTGLQEEVPVCW